MAVSDVKSVRVSRGRSRVEGALIKGFIGTGIGVAAGAVLGAVFRPDPEYCDLWCSRLASGTVGGTLLVE